MLNITKHPVKGQQKYRSKSGKEVFRYIVTGTDAEIAEYKLLKGAFFADKKCPEHEGKPLFFSIHDIETAPLRKNKEDFAIDMTEGEWFQALAGKYGVDYARVKLNIGMPLKAVPVVEEKE
jgi:hypothetical protein